MSEPRFNYIITIHNKEELIEQVLLSILIGCRGNSHIYPVLDGCTDRTEAIVDAIAKKYADVPITKVYAPDVHEIKSINIGLKAAEQEGEGYNIILQDDVVLAEFALEQKIMQLYEWGGANLGFVSFRLGANLEADALTSTKISPFTDYVENAYGHGLSDAQVLLPGCFAYRTIPIKSPVCIPSALVRTVGLLDERLAPYMCDDVEYAIRCTKAGFQNGVFGIRFYSDVKWGTTRTKPDPKMMAIHDRNINQIREWYRDEIPAIYESEQRTEVIEIANLVSEAASQQALEAWEMNRQRLNEFKKLRGWRTYHRVKTAVKQTFRHLNTASL
jgi:glycosyltransferase involved in cell wall biosynthesis